MTTVACDQTTNTCSIPVPAPGFALVFLTSDALDAVSPTSTVTFPTTDTRSSATHISIDPNILVTSNGHTGMRNVRAGTTPGHKISGAFPRYVVLSSALALLAAVFAVAASARRW